MSSRRRTRTISSRRPKSRSYRRTRSRTPKRAPRRRSNSVSRRRRPSKSASRRRRPSKSASRSKSSSQRRRPSRTPRRGSRIYNRPARVVIKNIYDDREDESPRNLPLFDKLFPWWKPLSQGSLYVLFKDGRNEIIPKTNDAGWVSLGNNPSVKKILTTTMSSDSLDHFIAELYRRHPNLVQAIMNTRSTRELHDLLMKNADLLFSHQMRIRTNKDYHVG